jgi:hypothetical protein
MANDDVDNLGSSNLLSSSFAFGISDHHDVCLPLDDAHVLTPIFCRFTSKYAQSLSVSKYTKRLVSSFDERDVTASAINPILLPTISYRLSQ